MGLIRILILTALLAWKPSYSKRGKHSDSSSNGDSKTCSIDNQEYEDGEVIRDVRHECLGWGAAAKSFTITQEVCVEGQVKEESFEGECDVGVCCQFGDFVGCTMGECEPPKGRSCFFAGNTFEDGDIMEILGYTCMGRGAAQSRLHVSETVCRDGEIKVEDRDIPCSNGWACCQVGKSAMCAPDWQQCEPTEAAAAKWPGYSNSGSGSWGSRSGSYSGSGRYGARAVSGLSKIGSFSHSKSFSGVGAKYHKSKQDSYSRKSRSGSYSNSGRYGARSPRLHSHYRSRNSHSRAGYGRYGAKAVSGLFNKIGSFSGSGSGYRGGYRNSGYRSRDVHRYYAKDGGEKKDEYDNVMEVYAIAQFEEGDVSGEVVIDENGNVEINLDLASFDLAECENDKALRMAIYNEWNDEEQTERYGEDCTMELIGKDIFDPFGTGKYCDKLEENETIDYFSCSIGDVSGRFGVLSIDENEQRIEFEENISYEATSKKDDGFCSLRITPEAVYRRSVAFKCDDEKDTVLFCAPFVIKVDDEGK